MDLEEREGGTQKESGERREKKRHSKNILEFKGGQNGQKDRMECVEGKVWPSFFYLFFCFFPENVFLAERV